MLGLQSSPSVKKKQKKFLTKAKCTGHVFVVQGSLLHMACDVIGMTATSWLKNTKHAGPYTRFSNVEWLNDVDYEGRTDFDLESVGSNWVSLVKWEKGFVVPEAAPVMFVLHGDPFQRKPSDISGWYVQTVREYIVSALAYIADNKLTPKNNRDTFLIGVPIIGIRFYGGADMSGEITKGILDLLYHYASSYGVDFALVTLDKVAHLAALRVREEMNPKVTFHKKNLSQKSKDDLRDAILEYKNDNLVLFIGSGCSVPAGLPTWGKLLSNLAKEAGLSDTETNRLWKLGFLDQARFIEMRLGGSDVLTKLIASQLDHPVYGIQHALLQSLSIPETITTNYDILYEKACECADQKLVVIPYEQPVPGHNWILKLHGCIKHPEDIVLTREDYIRYNEQRQALAGMVQTYMLTKHMLFVGFSLQDENFHTIASTVRRASSRKSIGTSIQLFEDQLMEEMWKDDINFVCIEEQNDSPQGDDFSRAGRKVEILLDYFIQETVTGQGFLLDEKYKYILSEQEEEFGGKLKEFMLQFIHDPEILKLPSYIKLQKFLEHEFGFKYIHHLMTNPILNEIKAVRTGLKPVAPPIVDKSTPPVVDKSTLITVLSTTESSETIISAPENSEDIIIIESESSDINILKVSTEIPTTTDIDNTITTDNIELPISPSTNNTTQSDTVPKTKTKPKSKKTMFNKKHK